VLSQRDATAEIVVAGPDVYLKVHAEPWEDHAALVIWKLIDVEVIGEDEAPQYRE
jgi:hypothetical protein